MAGNGDDRPPRVLVAEDEFLVGMELESMLTEAGFEVVGPVGSVPRALDCISNDEPDVALLDVNLRGRRATPVADKLKEHNVPFVLVTGYARAQLPESAFQGAALLTKPIEEERLLGALRRAVPSGD